MSNFNIASFTDKIAALYVKKLHERLLSAKLVVVQEATKDLINSGKIQLLGGYTDAPQSISLDNYMRDDGGLDEEPLVECLSSALSEPIIVHAIAEAGDEVDNRIGPGKLWVLHEPLHLPMTFGAALVHVAKPHGVELFGQAWYDIKALKSMYLARIVWALARSNEAKKA